MIAVWYSAPGIPGIRRMAFSRSAIAHIAFHVVPPTMAAAFKAGETI